MQAIAREMAFSETTFVFPPPAPREASDFRVRIFTPASELPMAGHPTIGTAFALAHAGRVGAGTARTVFLEGVGPVPLALEWAGRRLSFAWMTRSRPQFGPVVGSGRGVRRRDGARGERPPSERLADRAGLLRPSVPGSPPSRRGSRWIARGLTPGRMHARLQRPGWSRDPCTSSRSITDRTAPTCTRGCSRPKSASPKTPRPDRPRGRSGRTSSGMGSWMRRRPYATSRARRWEGRAGCTSSQSSRRRIRATSRACASGRGRACRRRDPRLAGVESGHARSRAAAAGADALPPGPGARRPRGRPSRRCVQPARPPPRG